MAERFSVRQIDPRREVFLVTDEGKIIGGVWKAPQPFHDWYWGRVKVTPEHYDLEGCGVEKCKADAVNACCMDENKEILRAKWTA